MKVRGITFEAVKETAFKNPEVRAAYEEETRAEELRAVLKRMREKAGITSTEVAARMGISQPAVSKLEKNVLKTSIDTLMRYAAACNAKLDVSIR